MGNFRVGTKSLRYDRSMQHVNTFPFQEIHSEGQFALWQKDKIWWWEDGKIHHAIGENALRTLAALKTRGIHSYEIPKELECYPTGIDLQVHLRFPGQAAKETLAGGLFSALSGGYDTVLTMPNTFPYLDSAEFLLQARRELEEFRKKYFPSIHVLFTAAGTKGMQGAEAADIPALVQAGAAALTDDGWGVKSDEAMEKIFEHCANLDIPFLQHAEIHGHKGVATASNFQRAESLPEYPRNAESEMIRRDLRLLRKHKKARYHVLHISTRESLAEIRKAKEEGLPVTAEVTPHHLFFSNAEIPGQTDARSTSFKMNPPLFALEDREALREGLASGLIDFVSTDHAPHEAQAKALGWQKAPFGTRGMETALPVLVTLKEQGVLTQNRIVEVFSTVPRKFIGCKECAKPAGLVFVNSKNPWKVSEKDLPGISKNSCFLGAELKGKIEFVTMGEKIFQRNTTK